jgi:putative oxidoreductase
MTNIEKFAELTGRILMSVIFLLSGLSKIGQYAGTQAYMAAQGVPGALLPLVIAVEVGGAAALIIGFKTRWAAFVLAGFSLVSAALFHNNVADQTQMIMFLKNVAMAGGFLLLFANGPGPLSLDRKFGKA